MRHIYHPYFSSSLLKMQKPIIGKSYALTLTGVRRGWKTFMQVIEYPHPVRLSVSVLLQSMLLPQAAIYIVIQVNWPEF